MRSGGSPAVAAASRSASGVHDLLGEADEHHLVADRLHDPGAVRGDRVVRDRLPPPDEVRQRGGVEARAQLPCNPRDRRSRPRSRCRVRPRAPVRRHTAARSCSAVQVVDQHADLGEAGVGEHRERDLVVGESSACRPASVSAKPSASTDAMRASDAADHAHLLEQRPVGEVELAGLRRTPAAPRRRRGR